MGIKYDVKAIGDKKYLCRYTANCRGCYGTGELLVATPDEQKTLPCPTCQGSGKVDVTKQISVIVLPHKPKQKQK
jgi:DnaJ-class molecular chaperone